MHSAVVSKNIHVINLRDTNSGLFSDIACNEPRESFGELIVAFYSRFSFWKFLSLDQCNCYIHESDLLF